MGKRGEQGQFLHEVRTGSATAWLGELKVQSDNREPCIELLHIDDIQLRRSRSKMLTEEPQEPLLNISH